jgi:putative membrane protein
MLQPSIEKNDKKAKLLIWVVSIIVFVAVALLSTFKLNLHLGFDVHLFAQANALSTLWWLLYLLLA